MSEGVKEHVAVRVRVYTRRFGVLDFGLAVEGFPGGSVPRSGDGNDLLSVGWSRTLARSADGSQAGQLAFALRGRRLGQVGHAWSELISPNDTVELQVKVDRSPDPDGHFSKDWWTEFVGEVRTVKLDDDDTTVSCQDAMGRLSYEHFSYWRNLGEAVGSGSQEDIQSRLGLAGLASEALISNSIAGAAEAIFQALLYTRLGKRVRWDGGERLRWSDLHGYRFESDDFNVVTDLQSLAPEGSSWADAVSWAVDAPEFYEFYLDNVPEGELDRMLRNGGRIGAGISRPEQIRKKKGKSFLGGRTERFVIRPAPFPVYDPKRGGYFSTAWDALPTTVAWPWGGVKASTARQGDHIYSVYSVDLVNGNTQNSDNLENSSAQAQVVVDGERYAEETGYRPHDARSKRVAVSGGASATYTASQVELSRALAWQLASYHHFNDRFYSGTVTSSLDWRPRLGERYVAEGFCYYVEGHAHIVDPQEVSSTFTVTRGLTLPQYGLRLQGPALHMRGRAAEETSWQEEWRLFPDHLGRQRPGEEFPMKLQNVEDNRFLAEIGQHEDFHP